MDEIAQENHKACARANDYTVQLAAESGALEKFVNETQWQRIVEQFLTMIRLKCDPVESVNIGGVDIWLADYDLENCFYDTPKLNELVLFCLQGKFTKKDIFEKVDEYHATLWARARKDQELLERIMGKAGMPVRLIKTIKGESNV